MRSGVIAQKLGMTRVYTEAGEDVPVTVLRVDNCQVVAQRTAEKDGYTAVQLGVGQAQAEEHAKALRGHFARAEVEPKRKVAEFRVSPENLIDVGAEITADALRSRPVRRRDRHVDRQGFRRASSSATISAAGAPRTATRCRTARTARPASARIPARCSRARRWPAISATCASPRRTCRSSRTDVDQRPHPGARRGAGRQGRLDSRPRRGEAQASRRRADAGCAPRRPRRPSAGRALKPAEKRDGTRSQVARRRGERDGDALRRGLRAGAARRHPASHGALAARQAAGRQRTRPRRAAR